MTITINAQGAERKRLVKTISEYLGVPARYLGAPSFGYEIEYFTVAKDGSLSFDDTAGSETVEGLLERLTKEGFEIGQNCTDEDASESTPTENEPSNISISMPRELFTETALENLKALLTAKGALIKKALGVDSLPLEVTETQVSFPWLLPAPSADEAEAYETFICKLCEMARNQKRVTASEKPTDNEKYAFRCFLLGLGFIGNEYKAARKILLHNLSGNGAFKNGGAQHEISEQSNG